MLYALDAEDRKITATKDTPGRCPLCREAMIAKCGEIVVWHWSHYANPECDPWWEESAWHLAWKALAPPERTEVGFTANLMRRRADLLTPRGEILELQHSSMPVPMLREREWFYSVALRRRLIWLVDATDAQTRMQFSTAKWGLTTLWWKQPRKFFLFARRPVFLDLGGDGIFDLLSPNPEAAHTGGALGWGRRLTRERFIAWYVTGDPAFPRPRCTAGAHPDHPTNCCFCQGSFIRQALACGCRVCDRCEARGYAELHDLVDCQEALSASDIR